ncbi:Tapetum determinant [Thalictrum thalictroides]|uniref:Tapetum determinant n=1 Tax=Thalictrum thalictroides TaxID=46969 RepID=A0A7J6W400_THATH|nr:Tapetum determinant [Thalictrum thalictroides]
MESSSSSEVAEKQSNSYTYWVRNSTKDAAPIPVPRKLTQQDILSNQQQQPQSGSVWNKAGTWEEKNLNSWASCRIKELLPAVILEFSTGKAEIADVSKCEGDAFLVTVRNKKRVGYTYELTLTFKGEWCIQEENKKINGHIDVPEFTFGELDDLKIEIRLSEEKDLVQQDKLRIKQDLNLFLQPIREKLLQFELELKDSFRMKGSSSLGLAFVTTAFSVGLMVTIYNGLQHHIDLDEASTTTVVEGNYTVSASHHRKLLQASGPDYSRIGPWSRRCSASDINVNQGQTTPLPNGIPTYTVNIMNLSPAGCTISGIHLSCGWFSSARLINPSIFRRLGYDDCLVNDGNPLASGAAVSFQYANSFSYPLSVSSVTC